MALKLPVVGCLPAKQATEKALNDTVERVETLHDNIVHYHQVVHGAELLKVAAENNAAYPRQQVAQGPLKGFRHVLRRVRNFVNARDCQPSPPMQCLPPAISSSSVTTSWLDANPGEMEDLFFHDDTFIDNQQTRLNDMMMSGTKVDDSNELRKQRSSYSDLTSLQSQLSSVPSTVEFDTSKSEDLSVPRVRRRPRVMLALRSYLRRARHFIHGQLRPKNGGHNDQTLKEKCLNILTCVPFVIAGRNVLRNCEHPKSRRFGHMFLVVAGVAAAYHGSGQQHRRGMRMLDYWSIAMSSNFLRAAALRRRTAAPAALNATAASITGDISSYNFDLPPSVPGTSPSTATWCLNTTSNKAKLASHNFGNVLKVLATASACTRIHAYTPTYVVAPRVSGSSAYAGNQVVGNRICVARAMMGVAEKAVGVVSVVGIPFAPCLVSSLNFLLVEARFCMMALQSPQQLALRYLLHILTSCTAGVSFFLEDVVVNKKGQPVPGMHAAFHVLSAAGIGTLAPFLQHLEQAAA